MWSFDADTRRILVARALRNFGYGMASVLLGLHLQRLGFEAAHIGLLLALTLAGSVIVSLAFAARADRWGRRRSLVVYALAMAASGLCFALSGDPMVLALACLTGTVSPTAAEVAPFLSLELAIVAQRNAPERRTRAFAVYSLLGSFAGAAGALFLSAAAATGRRLDLSELAVGRGVFLSYALLGLGAAFVLARLAPGVEAPPRGDEDGALRPESRRTVAKLGALFSVDALAGGFVIQSVLALWFHERFGFGLERLGAVFFAAQTLSALSFLAAERVATRIGLLNTMVFTHLPSNVLLMMVPLVPTPGLAVATLLARQAISQMDVPTRQSFVMAVVAPHERVAAAAITTTARSVAAAVAPALAGYALGAGAGALPFLLAGGLKIAYDLALWAAFRGVREA